jgi:hypothetical protein
VRLCIDNPAPIDSAVIADAPIAITLPIPIAVTADVIATDIGAPGASTTPIATPAAARVRVPTINAIPLIVNFSFLSKFLISLPHPESLQAFWNTIGKDIKNFERKEKLTIKGIALIVGTLTLAAAGVAIGVVLAPGAPISVAITSAVTAIGMGNVIAIGASAITALSIGAGLSMHSLTKDKKKIILEHVKESLSVKFEGHDITEKNMLITFVTKGLIENSNGNTSKLIKNCANEIEKLDVENVDELVASLIEKNAKLSNEYLDIMAHEENILTLKNKIIDQENKEDEKKIKKMNKALEEMTENTVNKIRKEYKAEEKAKAAKAEEEARRDEKEEKN